MREIATVNGINVYSDKNLSNIANTRLSFSDGSWCDVATGKVFNNGSGFISIGQPIEGAGVGIEVKTSGPKSYSATVLQVIDVEADVNVEPYDGNQIVVETSGSQSEIDNIRVREQSGVLFIEGTGSSPSRGTVVRDVQIGGKRGGGISMSLGNVSIGGTFRMDDDSISISGDGSPSSAQIKVKVPRGTSTSFAGVQGKLNVGDTDGAINLSVQGGWNANVGRVRDANLSLQGGADIEIAHVRGALSISLQGSGDILVQDGSIESLNANLQGSGDIKVGGTAQFAMLNLQGSGDIVVAHVVQPPMRRTMGSGDIKVRRIG